MGTGERSEGIEIGKEGERGKWEARAKWIGVGIGERGEVRKNGIKVELAREIVK